MSSSYSVSTYVQTVTSFGPVNGVEFQGWYIHPDKSLEAINCPSSQSWMTTLNYAQCCNVGATTCSTFWTSCAGTAPVGIGTQACGSGLTCTTLSIFAQSPTKPAPVYTQIICAPPAWAASSIYRAVVTTTLTSQSVLVGASTTSTVSPGSTLSTSTASSTGAASTSGAQTGPTQSSGSTSKAWIAGAVIGPVVAIIIVALIAWIYRLKKNKHANAAAAAGNHPDTKDEHAAKYGSGYYDNPHNGSQTHYSPQQSQPLYETHGTTSPYGQPAELPGQSHQVAYELPGHVKP